MFSEVYYIHTKVFSRKSFVVSLHTHMSSGQSDSRTRFIFTCEKNDTSNQISQKCVSLALKFSPFFGACRLQRACYASCIAEIQRESSYRETKTECL